MSAYQLALFNAAVMKAPLESPLMADFVAGLDRIHAIAEASPGFVWRMRADDPGASALRIGTAEAAALQATGEHLLVNLSVWRDVAAVEAFVYGPAHAAIMRRGREWFVPLATGPLVLWWVDAGARPDLDAGLRKLLRLSAQGPGAEAFTFRCPFAAPDAAAAADSAPG